jgi:O-antigen/teichoic acid export membrane protein
MMGRRSRMGIPREQKSIAVEDDYEPSRQLVAGGIVLTIATFAATTSNYLFQVLAGRILGPSQYSLLSSLFTVVAVVTISTSALQAACAKQVSTMTDVALDSLPIESSTRRHGLFDDPLVRRTGALSIACTSFILAASPLLAEFLSATVPEIIAVALLLPSAALLAVAFGRLQGLERFVAYALLGLGLSLAKLLFGVGALAFGLGISGGLGILALTSTIGAGLGLWYSRDAGLIQVATIRTDVVRALLAIGFFTLMISVDIPMARHFLSSGKAGQYAAAAVIGHGVIWLPEVVALVMFPEMVKARATKLNDRRLLLRSAAIAFSMCIAGVLILVVTGPFIFQIFYGSRYSGASSIAWKIALATVPFAVANLFLYDQLAGRRSRFIAIVVACLTIEALSLLLFHSSSTAFVLTIGGCGLLLALALAPWRHSMATPPQSESSRPIVPR